MAITREGFELLCWARSRSPKPWEQVLTLGRQSVVMPRWERREWEGTAPAPLALGDFLRREDDATAGEQLISRLDAVRVDAMDTSDYEGANVIHNLNEPVPEALVMAYDVVFDGGTLEHVFDYPRALANSLRMVRPGGWFLAATPSNHWCGHGFYQPGPEIFRMALQPAFGFELQLLAFAGGGFRKKFWVCAPERLGDAHRLGISKPYPTTLLVAARRVNQRVPDEIRVEQSDYTTRWIAGIGEADATPPPSPASPAPPPAAWRRTASGIARLMPRGLRERLGWWLSQRRHTRRLERGLRECRQLPR